MQDDFTQGYPQAINIEMAGNILYQEKDYDGEVAVNMMDINDNNSHQIRKK